MAHIVMHTHKTGAVSAACMPDLWQFASVWKLAAAQVLVAAQVHCWQPWNTACSVWHLQGTGGRRQATPQCMAVFVTCP